jgi:hypothetical protein
MVLQLCGRVDSCRAFIFLLSLQEICTLGCIFFGLFSLDFIDSGAIYMIIKSFHEKNSILIDKKWGSYLEF